VDGSDPKWLEEKKKYKPELDTVDAVNRYRDWENLKYWFRGVEKFAPWVNNIYFVTWGHLPKFLNTNHPKIKIVNHRDIIDEKYLPIYNSSGIEVNIFKIKGLSEKFVYFNDDVFLTDFVKPTDFFKDDLPCDEFAENVIGPSQDIFTNMLFNNVSIISKYFDKGEAKKRLKNKYFNLKYGKNNIRTLLLSPYKYFVGFYDPHISQAYLKSNFEKVYELEKNEFENTTSHKFRDKTDITQYLVRYYQLLSGSFVPRSSSFGIHYEISNDSKKMIESIKKQKYKVICLNDSRNDFDFEKTKKVVIDSFEAILPEKSSFEK
jgi:hypothetical protein